jgi:hypothetical protein
MTGGFIYDNWSPSRGKERSGSRGEGEAMSGLMGNAWELGTRYGVIYIGSAWNAGKPSEYRSRSSGTGLGERDLTASNISI